MAAAIIKFGGSNFKTISDYKQVHHVLGQYRRPVAAVVSAYYGITNRIQELVHHPDAQQTATLLEDLHSITQQLRYAYPSTGAMGFDAATQAVKQLGRLLKSSRLQHEPYQQSLTLSYGERINALWLVATLQAQGEKAVYSPPENIGLHCSDDPWFASIDFDASTLHANTFKHEAVHVVPGFYAMDYQQRVCLLGRGGSDYAAAAIAKLIKAPALDLWKDVNGFCTANPRFVKETQTIRSLSYAEAAELAYFGSELLHPRSTEPLQSEGIPIRLFNIGQAERSTPGTIIEQRRQHAPQIIKSITHSANFAILELQGSGVGMLPGLLAQVTGTLQEADINIKSVITAQTDINLLLAADDAEKALNLLQGFNIPGVVTIRLQTDIAVVATVGEGLAATYGIAAKVLTALTEKAINIRLMAIGASKVAGYFIISQKEQQKAVEAIHNALFKIRERF